MPLVLAWVLTTRLEADDLSAADREALLERLEKLRAAADSRVDARFRSAIAAYRGAMASDAQTIDFYLKCIEKVNFEDQKRRSSDFRDWKRAQDENLKNPAFRRALRHQLRWLVLTLQAASTDADKDKLAAGALEIIDSIFSDPKAFAGQEDVLRQPVTGTVFARAYEISGVKLEDWSLSPAQIDDVFEKILLPPYRRARDAAGIRKGWQKRIQYELAAIEAWSAPRATGGRSGMASDMRPPAYDKFLVEAVPELQWQMEMDAFKHGDQSGAAIRMLGHLDKHLTHSSARDWGEQFATLLRPPVQAGP